MKATAIILAAGEGKRMGMPKALLEYEKGKSFLRALATTFGKAGCDVLAVVGASAEDIRGNTPDVRIVENDAWREGQLSSARAGLRAALDDGADVIVVHPVDMPAVRTSTIKTLLTKLDGADAVVPEFEGAAGHPLVLTRAGAEKILSEQGAATLEEAVSRLQLRRVQTKDPGVVVNVNSPDVYERIFGSAPKLAPPPKRGGHQPAQQSA